MIFLSNASFCLLAMMLNETGLNCRFYRRTTSWRIVVFCIIGLMQHPVNCNNPSCLSGDCDADASHLIKHDKRLDLKQREHELMEKQKELHLQFQQLYSERHQLEIELSDEAIAQKEVHPDSEYEIPSYCANCLGDMLEPSTRSSLSSEFSRKASEETSTSSPQMPQLSDHGRLEAIKLQILLKLGLKNKPNVTSTLPKQFIYNTLNLSGEDRVVYKTVETKEAADVVVDSMQLQDPDEIQLEELRDSAPEAEQEIDEFYGRTREIITFAEKGKGRLIASRSSQPSLDSS
jgi:hypothetical protein